MPLPKLGTLLRLHLMQRDRLLTELRNRLERPPFRFYPEFSGKMGLFRLAVAVRSSVPAPVALLPDFICNIVHLAFERAGYSTISYRTDDLLEPDADEIRNELEQRDVRVLLTANVFGSSAFLDQLGGRDWCDLVARRNVHVIVDLCQDIRLIQHLPSDYGHHLSAVVSFNDKSFPGAMGGGVLTQLDLPCPSRDLGLRGERFLYRWALSKTWRYALRPALRRFLAAFVPALRRGGDEALPFEYGYCTTFPWTFEDVRITKIQLALAVLGLRNLESYDRRKQQLLGTGLPIRKTKFYATSPYVIVDPSVREVPAVLRRRHKPTYAVHGSPERSLHPDMLIIHNKGFCDGR